MVKQQTPKFRRRELVRLKSPHFADRFEAFVVGISDCELGEGRNSGYLYRLAPTSRPRREEVYDRHGHIWVWEWELAKVSVGRGG